MKKYSLFSTLILLCLVSVKGFSAEAMVDTVDIIDIGAEKLEFVSEFTTGLPQVLERSD